MPDASRSAATLHGPATADLGQQVTPDPSPCASLVRSQG
jgi:hypothetical protein